MSSSRIEIRNQNDFIVGLIYILVGVLAAVLAFSYRLGSAQDMGAGYFPFGLGIIITVMGIALLLASIRPGARREVLERWDFRTLAIILSALIAFGILVSWAGLAIAVMALVGISSFADRQIRLLPTLANMVFMSVFVSVVFVYLLGLPIPIFPTFRGPSWI